MQSVKQAKKALNSFSARGSNCPLCHKDFRYGCSHSISQAKQRLEENLLKAIIREEINHG